MSEQPAHLWIVGGTRRDRDAALETALPRPPPASSTRSAATASAVAPTPGPPPC